MANWGPSPMAEPTALAERRRNETFDFVKDVLQNHIIEASVYMTGSFPLKTYLPDSDIDIMLCIPEAKQGCAQQRWRWRRQRWRQ